MSPRVSADQRDQYLQDRREEIINAAVEVFGKKGFAGASVSEIARAAGIAKGTVYLYFQSKEEIFTAILVERSFLPQLEDLMLVDEPLERTLTDIAHSYFDFMDSNLPVFRIAIADSYHFPMHAQQVFREIILKGNLALADFLSKLCQAGIIPPLEDPFLTARVFLGLLSTHILAQEILEGKQITPIPEEDWIREIVRVFLAGLSPCSQ